ncbi:hypothetical protein M9978_22700 [Sphingomonas sp. MG17]|uniref:Uncharacterized protein n=1 Tax=Sphingomonas tagetis TaxID=2949092 RepID=A0A9X2HTI8_9SPHN|nr:hypothetical protein [Sphingomonas tagetis]MCP3733218.1 hypothetical protein [Sphingomonas tagetis]
MDGRAALALPPDAFRLAAAREAIASLGLVVSEAEGIIWHMLDFRLTDHPKARATAYRKNGEQLSAEEKRALGLRSNAYLSRRAFSEITSKGMASPLEAHEKVLLRASFSLFRYLVIQNPSVIDGHEVNYLFDVLNIACPVCKPLNGTTISGNDAPMFALPGCECETANFGYRAYVDWLANIE